MKILKTDANTSIHELSKFFNDAGKAAHIRAKKENGTVVLYTCHRSLLDALREKFSTTYREQVNENRQLAKKTIKSILNKSERGGRLDQALTDITQHLDKDGHDIRAAKIRAEINALDTSKGIFKISRDEVLLAWHASLDEFIFTDRQSQADGIKKLQSIGNMSGENKQTLTNLIRQVYPVNPEVDTAEDPIKKGIDALTYFMKAKGGSAEFGGVDYLTITKFIRTAHTAISELTKNKTEHATLLKQFDVEPLKSAKLFFSAYCNPRITPLKIEISDPQKTTFGQRWEETLEDYVSKPSSLSKADALKEVARQNLEDRQNLPDQTIKIFLPEGVSKNEIQAAFLEAQNILRDKI
jgi:hypothetical protein